MAAVVHRLSNAAASFFDSPAPAVVVGLVTRLKVSETPVFHPLEDENEERKVPLLTVFKRYERQGFGALFATMTIQGTQGLTTVWGG